MSWIPESPFPKDMVLELLYSSEASHVTMHVTTKYINLAEIIQQMDIGWISYKFDSNLIMQWYHTPSCVLGGGS